MKVLVTGASGFLGSHVVDRCLEAGYQVRVIVRPSSDCSYLESLGDQIEILKGDFTNSDFLDQSTKDIDGVIHSAARVTEIGHRDEFYRDNVVITERLINSAKKNGVGRFVFVSSPSAIAELKDQINIDESYPFPDTFLNYYCETKAIAEQKALAYNSLEFCVCAIRPRAVWGPRDISGPFAKFMKKMHQEKLKDVSGGRVIQSSICYVRNAANACVLALTANQASGKAYFITDTESVNLWSFANQMADTFGLPRVTKKAPVWLVNIIVNVIEALWQIPYLRNHVAPPVSRYSVGLITNSATYNITGAQRDLGYRADISLPDAIAEYKTWVESEGGVDAYLSKVPA